MLIGNLEFRNPGTFREKLVISVGRPPQGLLLTTRGHVIYVLTGNSKISQLHRFLQ